MLASTLEGTMDPHLELINSSSSCCRLSCYCSAMHGPISLQTFAAAGRGLDRALAVATGAGSEAQRPTLGQKLSPGGGTLASSICDLNGLQIRLLPADLELQNSKRLPKETCCGRIRYAVCSRLYGHTMSSCLLVVQLMGPWCWLLS